MKRLPRILVLAAVLLPFAGCCMAKRRPYVDRVQAKITCTRVNADTMACSADIKNTTY